MIRQIALPCVMRGHFHRSEPGEGEISDMCGFRAKRAIIFSSSIVNLPNLVMDNADGLGNRDKHILIAKVNVDIDKRYFFGILG